MTVTERDWVCGTGTLIWTGEVGGSMNWFDLVASEGSAFPVPGEGDIVDLVASHAGLHFALKGYRKNCRMLLSFFCNSAWKVGGQRWGRNSHD